MFLASLYLLLLVVDQACAIRVPLTARTRTPPRRRLPSRFQRRANTTTSITSDGNTQYTAKINVGSADFVVTLDTGSSDLWISGNVPTTSGLGTTASITYAVGEVAGEINKAVATFSGFVVPDQNYSTSIQPASLPHSLSHPRPPVLVPPGSASGFTDIDGILGLGPSSSSVVRSRIGDASGAPFLDRVFRQNVSTPNFITFTLGREGDTGSTIQGQLTIGELIPGLEAVATQPQLPVKALPGPLKTDQHWSGTIDSIIGPDGKTISVDSVVPGVSGGKAVVIYDSGFTLPQVSHDVSDAIYGRVRGASFDTQDNVWLVPCDQEVNLTIVIGGQKYPVHPLDTVSSDLNATNANGDTVCVGTFQPITTALDGTFDFIMGMGFLRNTYTSINFGDFVDGDTANRSDPYMQLLALTDPAAAHKDFVALRLNGKDTTGDAAHSLLPAGETQHSPQSTAQKAKSAFFRYWIYIIAAVAGLLALSLVVCVWRCCCGGARRGKWGGRGRTGPGLGGGNRGFQTAGTYRPLQDPAPQAAMGMHPMGPPPQGSYQDPYYRG
ncbi:acid protease [Hysterangium stoloniferum]|nr:acid protease [Hysterangium stoloniferum]